MNAEHDAPPAHAACYAPGGDGAGAARGNRPPPDARHGLREPRPLHAGTVNLIAVDFYDTGDLLEVTRTLNEGG